MAACDRRGDELVAAVGDLGDDEVIGIDLDVTSQARWETAVERVVDRFGSLTTLVNNAGVLHRASLADETAEGFENAWRVNCLGAFLGIQATLEHLRAAQRAAIVNICSTGAIRPFPRHSAYGSSKWALRGLTQNAAAELAPLGIRVNAVFPGPIATPMLDDADPAEARRIVGVRTDRSTRRDRRRGRVSGFRRGVIHHRFGTGRRRWAMRADPMSLSVGIIGAGPGGMALGILLAQAGLP